MKLNYPNATRPLRRARTRWELTAEDPWLCRWEDGQSREIFLFTFEQDRQPLSFCISFSWSNLKDVIGVRDPSDVQRCSATFSQLKGDSRPCRNTAGTPIRGLKSGTYIHYQISSAAPVCDQYLHLAIAELTRISSLKKHTRLWSHGRVSFKYRSEVWHVTSCMEEQS